MILRVAFVLMLAFASFGALAQVQQTGTVTRGHAGLWYGSGILGDAGGAAGSSTSGAGYLTELGITATGTPFCINDALTNAVGGYHQFCIGANSLGGGLLSYNAYGGAAPLSLQINVNGTNYAFPGSGSGNVTGPGSSTINNLPCFNNTGGTLLKDCGIPIATTGLPTTYNAGSDAVIVYTSKTGTDSGNCQSVGSPCLTIAYTIKQALLTNVKGGNIHLTLTGGGTWAEDVLLNGALWGTANTLAIPSVGNVWPSMLLVDGSGTATINSSGNFCGAVIASQNAIIGLENVTITANKSSCQSPIFVQMAGTVHIFGGVTIGASGSAAEQIHVEDSGSSVQIWQNYTLTGGGASAFGVSSHGEVVIGAGVGTISGSPAYTTAFIFMRSGGMLQSNINNPWGTPPATATGLQFALLGNAVLDLSGTTAIANIPGGTTGYVDSGARVRGPLSATIGTSSGLGTGTAALTFGSPRSGQIMLSPTGSPGNTGTQNVTMPFEVVALSNTQVGTCVAGPLSTGTGSWNAGASFQPLISSATNLRINWSNNGVALSAGSTYAISYLCDGD